MHLADAALTKHGKGVRSDGFLDGRIDLPRTEIVAGIDFPVIEARRVDTPSHEDPLNGVCR